VLSEIVQDRRAAANHSERACAASTLVRLEHVHLDSPGLDHLVT
jgi:hypothetical protein